MSILIWFYFSVYTTIIAYSCRNFYRMLVVTATMPDMVKYVADGLTKKYGDKDIDFDYSRIFTDRSFRIFLTTIYTVRALIFGLLWPLTTLSFLLDRSAKASNVKFISATLSDAELRDDIIAYKHLIFTEDE